MSKVFCWDIDGTLLTTGKAGIFAYEEAVFELFNIKIDLWELETEGFIDPKIAAKILKQCLIEPSEQAIHRLLEIYGQRLPICLNRKNGYVMKGVKEFIEKSSLYGKCFHMLLTGNTLSGAKAKLEYYGLINYFPEMGAFSDGMTRREEIAEKAFQIAQDKFKLKDVKHMFVIGDTPYDILCGKAIGAKTISVATGKYSLADLAKCGPDYNVECIDWTLLNQVFNNKQESGLNI